MSNSVVSAAAVAHAKQLVRNKKFVKQAEDQKPAQDEQQAADKDDDTVHMVQADEAQGHHESMSTTSLSGNSTFVAALSAAADSSAALAESAQDDTGGMSDDGGSGGSAGGTVLLVGAVALAGLGVAVLADGGGDGDNGGPGPDENQAPVITSADAADVDENVAAGTVVYTAAATDADGDTVTYTLGGTDAAAFTIDEDTGAVSINASPDFEAKGSYTFEVTASDGEDSDTQTVTLTINDIEPETPVATDVSIDGTGPTQPAQEEDASTAAFNFTDDANVDSNVIISGFGEDDVITVTNATADDYSFGTGADANDLEITFNNGTNVNIIVLDDVLTGFDGFVFDEASAEAALATVLDVEGSNFFNFA